MSNPNDNTNTKATFPFPRQSPEKQLLPKSLLKELIDEEDCYPIGYSEVNTVPTILEQKILKMNISPPKQQLNKPKRKVHSQQNVNNYYNINHLQYNALMQPSLQPQVINHCLNNFPVQHNLQGVLQNIQVPYNYAPKQQPDFQQLQFDPYMIKMFGGHYNPSTDSNY
jgi:hypothetical protein